MAELVLGLATSHSPLLSTPPEYWDLRAKADRSNRRLYFRGRAYDFDTLVWERAPGFANQTSLETRRERYARCQDALDALAKKFREAAPDAVVIVGNDQREIFSDSLTPAITVYRGNQIENIPFTREEPSPGLAIAEHGNCPQWKHRLLRSFLALRVPGTLPMRPRPAWSGQRFQPRAE